MALTDLRKNFTAKAAAIGLGAMAAFAPLSSAYADSAQATRANYAHLGMCADYEVNEHGVQLGAFGSAVRFSEAEENDIAVVVYTGTGIKPEDALRGAEKFASVFGEHGLRAQCFVGGHDPAKGTSFLFLVNGYLVPETRGLNASQAIAELENVAAEARMVRESGIKGDPRYHVSRLGPTPAD